MADADDEDPPDESGVPKTRKGTLRGTGAVKNPLLAAAEAKYEKKVPLSQPPAPIVAVSDPETEAVVEKVSIPKPKAPGQVKAAPPPPAPPPPPPIEGKASLSKPPPAPPPPRPMPPSPISGIPKPGKTKLGVPQVELDASVADTRDGSAPGAEASRVAADDLAIPAANPLGDPRQLLIAGAVAFAALLLLILLVSLSGGDDETNGAEEESASGADTEAPATPTAEEASAEAASEPAAPLETTPEPIPTVELTPEQHDEIEGLRETARAHYGAGRFLEAAADYRAASEIDPSHAGVFAGMGASLSNAGHDEAAIAAYRRATELDPHSSGFRAALGRVLRQNGQEEAAIEAYREAIVIDPENRAARRAIREMTVE